MSPHPDMASVSRRAHEKQGRLPRNSVGPILSRRAAKTSGRLEPVHPAQPFQSQLQFVRGFPSCLALGDVRRQLLDRERPGAHRAIFAPVKVRAIDRAIEWILDAVVLADEVTNVLLTCVRRGDARWFDVQLNYSVVARRRQCGCWGTSDQWSNSHDLRRNETTTRSAMPS